MLGRNRTRRRPYSFPSLLCLPLLALPASPVRAGIIYVNAAATAAPDGHSWATAFSLLSGGLNAARAGDEVWVAKGLYAPVFTSAYLPLSLKPGVGLYGGFAGTETNRSQRSPVVNTTVIANNTLHADNYGTSTQTSLVIGSAGSAGQAGADTVVDGFTFQDGQGSLYTPDAGQTYYKVAGAVYVYGSPTIHGNLFQHNQLATTYAHNRGSANQYFYGRYGSAIFSDGGSPAITDNLFVNNGGNADGDPKVARGAVYCLGGAPIIANNTFTANTLQDALAFSTDCAARVANNIVANNNGGVAVTGSGTGAAATPALSHNDVTGNTADYEGLADPTGTNGNIKADPLFADAAGGNYHLQDASPAINGGDDAVVGASDTDLDGRPRVIGAHVDMGAYETGRILYVNGSSTGTTHDGLSWATAFLKAQNGVSAARAGDDVWVAQGTYMEYQAVAASIGLYGGFAGTEAARGQRLPKTNVTVLDGSTPAGDPNGGQGSLVYITADGVTLDGFTIQHGGGGTSGDSPPSPNGGGIGCTGNNVVIGSNLITGNVPVAVAHGVTYPYPHPEYAATGGGVYVSGTGATIRDNVITNNKTSRDPTTTSGAVGGGIACTGANARILRNVVNNNTAIAQSSVTGGRGQVVGTGEAYGGGIYAASSGGIIEDNLVTNNTADGSSSPSSDGGASVGSYGGGVYATGNGVVVANNTLVGNSATDGALYATGVVQNDIVAFNLYGIFGGGTLAKNCVYQNTFGSYGSDTAHASDINADPLFVNRIGGDDHLQAASPCVDVGLDSAVQPGDTDLDGRPRKLGGHVDIGAYELLPVNAGTFADAARALRVAAGLAAATTDDKARLNVETGGASANVIGIEDAARLVRKAVGLDA